jgi:NAD(P)-dependent dehydrogenase (short-subunit alcohol dehydrogenase family)
MYGLVKSMACELGVHGINVNGINPGAIVSAAEWRHFGDTRERYDQWILENQSLKRRIKTMDIANAAVFLCSERAALITGQDINVDAGW